MKYESAYAQLPNVVIMCAWGGFSPPVVSDPLHCGKPPCTVGLAEQDWSSGASLLLSPDQRNADQ